MRILAVKARNVQINDLLRWGSSGTFRRIQAKITRTKNSRQSVYFTVIDKTRGLVIAPFVSGDYVVVKRPKKNYTRKYR